MTEQEPHLGAVTDIISQQPEGPERSIVDRVRTQQKHSESADNTLDLDIPGYDGQLFARYGLVEGKKIQMISDKAQREYKNLADRALVAAQDTIIEACQEIFFRDPDEVDSEGKPKEISIAAYMTEQGEEGWDYPVRFDDKLAEFFRWGPDDTDGSARNVLYKVFGKNDVAVANHNLILSRWMADPSRDPMGGLLGELGA